MRIGFICTIVSLAVITNAPDMGTLFLSALAALYGLLLMIMDNMIKT
jgi:hypothetical protein